MELERASGGTANNYSGRKEEDLQMGIASLSMTATGVRSVSSSGFRAGRSVDHNHDFVLASRWKRRIIHGTGQIDQSFIKTNFSFEKRSSSAIACIKAAGPPGSRPEDSHDALDAVIKLYTAIKNQNLRDISDIIGDECRCICNFFSSFQPFVGKQQVLNFFAYLIRILGKNVEFVIQPTVLDDGLNVGVRWKLEWKHTHIPLGKGFSFYICQIYQGKVVIRNIKMFMEPLLHLEPFRLKLMRYATIIVDKISSFKNSNSSITRQMLSIFMMVVVAIVLFLITGLY